LTAKVIMNTLKENPTHGGMTRQDLQDVAQLYIGDRGLMDHVLKEMNKVIILIRPRRAVERKGANMSNKSLQIGQNFDSIIFFFSQIVEIEGGGLVFSL